MSEAELRAPPRPPGKQLRDKLLALAPDRADEIVKLKLHSEAIEFLERLEAAKEAEAKAALAERTNRQSDVRLWEEQRRALEAHRRVIREARDMAAKQAAIDRAWQAKIDFANEVREMMRKIDEFNYGHWTNGAR